MSHSVHPRVKKARRIRLLKYSAGIGGLLFIVFVFFQYLQQAPASTEKQYTLTIDGADFTLRCAEPTVGECFRKENIIVYERDYLWPEMTTNLVDGMHVIVRRAVPVTFIDVVGESKLIYTYGTTVKDVVNDLELSLGENMRITPSLETWLEEEMTIQVLAEREEKITRTVDIAFAVEKKNDATLLIGKTSVEQKGVVGKKQETYQMVYIGDTLKEKKLLSSEVLVSPKAEVVRVGTQVPTRTEMLAEGKASYYGAKFAGARTASGIPLQINEFVAAHRTLPFGSIVKVTNVANNKSVIVRIVDRGPYIAGRVIDLTPAAFQQIGAISSGILNVRLDLVVD